MSLPEVKKRYTPAEYYALEHVAEYKSDYYDGEIFEIFAISGGTSTHSLITLNVAGELRQRLNGKPCTAYESNMRLKVAATGLRTYPDASVYCGPLAYDPEDPALTTAMNPTVVVEVLSPSTAAYDQGFKARHYRLVETLRAYVLVSQEERRVELHEREPGRPWTIRDLGGPDVVIPLDAIGIELPLAEIYDRVEFPAAAPAPPPPPLP